MNAEKIVDYDDEPVKYCTRCLSLKIKYEATIDVEYCGDCGCTDVIESTFDEWESKYTERYGHKLVEKSNDPKTSPIYRMSRRELTQLLYSSEHWKEVITRFYPSFPANLSRIDSVILFFNKLIEENRVEEFKLYIIKEKLLG